MAHIVLVEDDALLSEMYQQALLGDGHACNVALDGLSGWRMIEANPPDLVLLDLMLPQMSGDEVLTLMRNNPKTKHTKVIIMTNISKSEAPEILDSLEFEQYIVKANTTLSEVTQIVNAMFSAGTPGQA